MLWSALFLGVALLTLIGWFWGISTFMSRLESLTKAIQGVSNLISLVDARVDLHDTTLVEHKDRMDVQDDRIEGHEGRIVRLEEQVFPVPQGWSEA